jgi:hypothetical protein
VRVRCQSRQRSSISSGERKPWRFLGRLFSFLAIAEHCDCVTLFIEDRFAMYWRIRPFVFSFVPRSQEWYGVAGPRIGVTH